MHQTRPDAVPDQVRAHFGRLAASGDPQAVAAAAATLLQEALRTRDRAALNTAIGLLRQAVATSPNGHPGRARWLSDLGLALQIRFERAGNLTDLDAAITASQQAVAMKAAAPRVRALAARVWVSAASAGGRWQEAAEGFAAAAELVGLVAPRSLTRADREHLLEELGSLGADAAACCVASAFQLAGYRHVIATMWPISDLPAVNIADRIYNALTTTDGSDAADAVHATARLMRQRWGPDAPWAWASHTHAGA